jgi:poly(hydroxyalkanoate) depolymerase family esterase
MDEFGSNPGALRARTYIPENLRMNPALIVVLHGCTQSAAAYDRSAGWSHLADRHGFILLFPEQRRTNNPNLCFNWFSHQHNRRGQGEALSIAQMISAVTARHGIDASSIFVTGLSAGGAMTSVMLATYPELFAGGAIIAGLAYGLASSVPQAFEAMRGQIARGDQRLGDKVRAASHHRGPWPKISVWHGSADRTVDVGNASAILDQWKGVHGVAEGAPANSSINGFSRRAWQDSNGWDVVEEFIIPGMGHGVPLDPSLPEAREVAAAFMLDVGISSTREIARFWGLTDTRPRHGQRVEEPRSVRHHVPAIASCSPRFERDEAEEERALPHHTLSKGVQKVIEDAFRSAGLMK